MITFSRRPNPTRRTDRRPLIVGLLLVAAIVAWNLPASAQSDGSELGLSLFSAIVLGLVEGFTEYLPVSSTGHLLVANKVLGLGGTTETDAALEAYAICIQAGAILAVLVLYQERVRQLIDGLLGRSEDGRRILLAVIAAFVPTAIIGLTFSDLVRENLFGVTPIAIAWLVGGVAILGLTRKGVLKHSGQELYEITLRQAAIIGVGQALALWPGVSRSLVTIVVAVLVGLTLRAAVEFSFLLGLVTLTAATALTALSEGSLLIDTFGVATPLAGLVVAFGAALASVRWMVSWLEQRSFAVFGVYRIGIGGLALVAVSVGWL